MALSDDPMEDLLESPELIRSVNNSDSDSESYLRFNPLNESTFVTALYDIGREQLAPQYNNHRKFSTYLSWFKNLLALPLNLVIYVPKALEKFVLNHRSQYDESHVQTQIVVREFDELPYAKDLQRFKDVLTTMENTNKGQIEMILPEYNVVTFSKFPLVQEVAQRNPYQSKYVFWIDAGYLRTPIAAQDFSFDPYRFTCVSTTRQVILSQTGAHPERLLKFRSSKSSRSSSEIQLIKRIRVDWEIDSEATPFVGVSEEASRSYFRGIPNDVNTAFWGGALQTVTDVCQLFDYKVCQVLDWGILNNDQGILSLVIAETPFLFQLIPGAGREHWFLLLNFANQVSPFVIQYPMCSQVKLFAMVTQEIPESKIRYWIDSATHFGYDYEILERDRPWKGWIQRTKAGRVGNSMISYETALSMRSLVLSEFSITMTIIPNGTKLNVNWMLGLRDDIHSPTVGFSLGELKP
jgi:hypothetical protein